MNNSEIVSNKQLKYMIIALIGSSILYYGATSISKQDSWMSILIAILFSIPLFLLYSFIINKNSEADIFDVCYKYFGNFIGKIVIVLFSLYFLMVAFISMLNTIEFLNTVTYLKTPKFVFALLFIFVNLYLVKKGIEVIGRIITVLVPVILFLTILSTIFIFPKMDFNNLKPFFSATKKDLFKNALDLFLFGFGDVVFLLALSYNSKKQKTTKSFIFGSLTAGTLLFIITITNITILGVYVVNVLVYPFYYSYSVINIGNFITRIEIIISINAVLFIMFESSIVTYACTKGINKLFKKNNYFKILITISIILFGLIMFIFNEHDKFEKFKEKTVLPAIIIQIAIPLIIGMFAIFKKDTQTTQTK